MRRVIFVLLVLIAGIAVHVLPVLSGDDDNAKNKDECLLITTQCGTSAQSIQDKIDRIKREIAKGTTVYSPEELRALKQALDEVNKTLDFLGSKPPYVDDRR
jgi:hypothetical protein